MQPRVGIGMGLTICGEECDGGALSTSASSSANSVHIVLRVVGVVVVHDMSNVLHIFKV
jgi:hypothetical protein